MPVAVGPICAVVIVEEQTVALPRQAEAGGCATLQADCEYTGQIELLLMVELELEEEESEALDVIDAELELDEELELLDTVLELELDTTNELERLESEDEGWKPLEDGALARVELLANLVNEANPPGPIADGPEGEAPAPWLKDGSEPWLADGSEPPLVKWPEPPLDAPRDGLPLRDAPAALAAVPEIFCCA
jgi:hypothetical protein